MANEAAAPQAAQAMIEELGLRRVAAEDMTITRVRHGSGARFIDTRRNAPVNGFHKKRIEALVIPPAWTDVRIARDKQAHLQAIGRDDAGRLQYIYHSAWEDVRAAAKAYRLIELGKALPRLRSAVAQDLEAASAHVALAAAVRLVDRGYLRAGHEAYAGEESGRGVATLLKRHVKIDGTTISLRFRGKGGKLIEKVIDDETLARALAKLMERKGARLFKLGSGQSIRAMTASDLNNYLVDRSRRSISAKDFRTLFASAHALERLRESEAPNAGAARRRIIAAVAREIAAELSNTPAIVRKSYIHPTIIEAYESRQLSRRTPVRARKGLSRIETALMLFLERTLADD